MSVTIFYIRFLEDVMLRSDIKNKLNEMYPGEYTVISRKKEYGNREYI